MKGRYPKLHTVLEQEIVNGKTVRAITRMNGKYNLYHITEGGDWVRVKSADSPLKLADTEAKR